MALVGGANHDVWGASVISDSGRVGSLGIPRQNRMATSSPTTSAATRADHKESEECVLERSHRATIRAFAGRDRCGPAFVTQPPWDFVTLPPRPPPSRYPFAGGFRYSTLSNERIVNRHTDSKITFSVALTVSAKVWRSFESIVEKALLREKSSKSYNLRFSSHYLTNICIRHWSITWPS